MNKKAQVTIFIIVAILIVAGLALYFVLREQIPREDETLTRDYSPLHVYIQECLDQTLAYVIQSNGIQGGYYTLLGNYVFYNDDDIYIDSSIPYYLIDGDLFLPSEKDLEDQISLGIQNEFENCLDFSSFNYEVDYNYSSLEVNSYIEKNIIRTSINLPISANDGKSAINFDKFNSEQESNYYNLYIFAKNLTGKQKTNGNNLCLSCLVEESEKSSYNIYQQSLVSNESYILINTLYDNEEDLFFNFAYKFNY